jgi:hypothetical protein
MRNQKLRHLLWNLAALCILGSSSVNAQFFSYSGTGDVLAGFRKTGLHQGNYELVVNLGNVTNFLAMTPGASTPISAFSPAQLSDAFPDGFKDLQWSAFSTFDEVTPWSTPLGSFPVATIWYTFARSNINVQSTPWSRYVADVQSSVKQPMVGIGQDASTISQQLGATNADNNSMLVREPILGYADHDLTSLLGDPSDPAIGDFYGTTPGINVENITPDAFASPSRSDFYQSVPDSQPGQHGRPGVTYIDPITGLTNGPAYFVGYFQLNTDGTMSFTRASTNSVTTAPPPVMLSVARASNTSTISFASSNSVTYTLFFTNSSGLTTPVANWPSLSATITGDGTTKSFQDTSTDPIRFYRVQEH